MNDLEQRIERLEQVNKAALDALIEQEQQPKGDGRADDTVAIQRLLDAGGGYLPPGVYRVTAPLTIPSGAYLTGAGEATSMKVEQEWVEWETSQGCHYRASVDGSTVERKHASIDYWEPSSPPIEAAYRKGRSVALEQVKELVRAVEEAHDLLFIVADVCRSAVGGPGQVDRIREAAKAVEL